jgi:hypothetical protein
VTDVRPSKRTGPASVRETAAIELGPTFRRVGIGLRDQLVEKWFPVNEDHVRPQQRLYLRPLPHVQGAFRPAPLFDAGELD